MRARDVRAAQDALPAEPRRRRGLTEEDRTNWAAYARDLRLLDGRAASKPPHAPEPPGTPEALLEAPLPAFLPVPPALPATARRHPLPPVEIGARQPGLDTGTLARFRTGKLAASRTLDLHGRTAQRAYAALHGFLRAAHADRVRCVEIITGRGSGPEGGVIRRELPLWLNLPELRPLVLAAAHPHPANPGSVRVLLKRVRA